MPPEISSTPQRSDIANEGQGNFLTKKIGPLPMWAIIAGVGVILYVLYTKFFAQGSPAVSTTPSTDTTTGTPFDNFSSSLGQIAANEQQIQSLLGTGASSTTNNTPPAAATSVASTYNPSQPAPTASPISGPTLNQTPTPSPVIVPPSAVIQNPLGAQYAPVVVASVAKTSGTIAQRSTIQPVIQPNPTPSFVPATIAPTNTNISGKRSGGNLSL
jgi:hypothetical protein